MSKKLSRRPPDAFGLSSFAEILSKRSPILGEEPGTFEDFRAGLVNSLRPTTPYECGGAENLVAIEWELLQRRRMRDAAIRRAIHQEVYEAVLCVLRIRDEEALDAAWQDHVAKGGDEDDWEEPERRDTSAMEGSAEELAERSVSDDPGAQAQAQQELADMGVSPIAFMGDAYAKLHSPAARHDEKLQELERRRREVKRDFDALVKSRPIKKDVEDAEVVEQ